MNISDRRLRRAFPAAASALVLLLLLAPSVSACSIFSFTRSGHTVYGRNLDWPNPFPGAVIVNPRGLVKSILPWSGSWPAPYDGQPVKWVSRYGSIAFTCYGRDFIEGGMNEAGLVVDEASLTAGYPPVDGRPGVSCAQWIQYQLDSYGTVEEVLEHLDDLRPDGEGWHYLIADAGGECAVIEYEKGNPLVYRGDEVECCALTNTRYRRALNQLPLDAAFGGDIDMGAGTDSYGRFVRVAALMRDYDADSDGAPPEYAFRILDEVSCYDTIRSVVYDVGGMRVWWRTPGNQAVRWLDFSDLDPGYPVMMLDVEEGGPGDVSGMLVDYSVDANRAIVSGVKDGEGRSPETDAMLRARGLTFDAAVEVIAAHPTTH